MDDEVENPALDRSLAKSGVVEEQAEVDNEPLYRVMDGSKVVVAKSLGNLWKSRIDQGIAARQDVEACWSEAIRYYENDQSAHRTDGQGNASGNRRFQRRLGEQWTETENVVFANATTMLPLLYAKNPQIECTPLDQTKEAFVQTCELLINAVMGMATAPGLNLKQKAKRGVLWTILTNTAYMKVGWVAKDDGNEAALTELQELTQQYAKAKTKKEIEEVEGKLQALEERINLLSPSGPTTKLVSPFRIVIDPTSSEPDHTDANWIAEYDFLPTSYLNAVYGKPQDGQVVSVYEPTHVLKQSAGGDTSLEDEVNNFSLFNKDPLEEAKNYGYQSTKAFKAACHTKVWWIWDKTTRRLFLYADNKWDWPLWVWDDQLQLLEFFPYEHLWFHETVEGSQPKGETTYYLDQQDAINDINSAVAQARSWARLNVIFNKNAVSQEDVEAILKGPDGTARGVDVPEGSKLSDILTTLVPPAMAHPELFSPDTKFAAINRLTGINDAQRGAQFKTNTTNDAVEAYQKNVDIRVDEKIDAIEDWIGRIGWKVLQILVRNWTVEDVAKIIGAKNAQGWQQITDPNILRTTLNLRIVGGSTDKPTSKNKKKQALEVGQVLGQFSSAIPAAGIVALKVIERAFKDEIVITQDDWDMIMQSMQDNMNKAGAGAEGQGGDPNAQQGGPAQEEMIKAKIEALPPEAKQQLQALIQKGMPPTQALQTVSEAVHQVAAAPGGQSPQKPATQPGK